MKLIEKNIEWLATISVVMITTMIFFNSLMVTLDLGIVRGLLKYANVLILFMIFLFQNRKYGIKIYDRAFFSFYIVYCLYLLMYITILRKYPLEDMVVVPGSIFVFFVEFTISILYLLCAKTFVTRFNVKYFIILSLIVCTIPTLFFCRLWV